MKNTISEQIQLWSRLYNLTRTARKPKKKSNKK